MKINGERLLGRLNELAKIGRTANGGVTRLALSSEDTAARCQVLEWAARRGFQARIDPIGNLFIRRDGRARGATPVVMGSHLDTQIDGGNLDGIYGVIAALEVAESLEDAGNLTERPLDVVIWNNEEGVRFAPVTMGSSVYSGKLDLESVLGHVDAHSVSVRQALHDSRLLHRLEAQPLGSPFHACIELHIEQGPILERARRRIGIVTGVQGVRQFEFQVKGEAAHAGTMPLEGRRDAFVLALEIYRRLHEIANTRDRDVRFTVGRMQVLPGAPNTVPAQVNFTVDLRHPDAAQLRARGERMLAMVEEEFEKSCTARSLIDSPPVMFDEQLLNLIESGAARQGTAAMRMISGATHDAARIAHLAPTAMIFVPSRDGISHNPKEWTEPADLLEGCALLAYVAQEAARTP